MLIRGCFTLFKVNTQHFNIKDHLLFSYRLSQKAIHLKENVCLLLIRDKERHLNRMFKILKTVFFFKL